MIDPASAFCIGVYFLGVGVVGSVLYIPISLMRAIEHYHLRRDGGKGKGSDSLDGDYLSLCGYNGNGEISSNSNNQSLCDDSSSLFHERPELLLIHKKKVLRNILNDNNYYLSNLVDFDERSDHSFGMCERFTTYQTSTSQGVGGSFGSSMSRNEFGGCSRRHLTKCSKSSTYPHDQETGGAGVGICCQESAREVVSTTSSSWDKDENGDHLEIVLRDEIDSLSLGFCQRIGLKKGGGGMARYCVGGHHSGAYTCSTNSTSSVMSTCETESGHNIVFGTARRGEKSGANGSFFGSDSMSRCDDGHKHKRGGGWSVFAATSPLGGGGDGCSEGGKVDELMILEEISAVHDILAL